MKINHQWKPENTPKTPNGFNDWHCHKCDSIVRFAVIYNASDVKEIMERKPFICMPPLPSLDKLDPNVKKVN